MGLGAAEAARLAQYGRLAALVYGNSGEVMHTFKADHGLLVSWSEFHRPAEQDARAMHFNFCLWGSDKEMA